MQQEQNVQIISRFDELLTTKSSKTSLQEVYEYMEKHCANRSENNQLVARVDSQFAKMN
jgi:hypothetical protein